MKTSLSIQDSRTSQPPRLTPRRNGILVLAAAEAVLLVAVLVGDGEELVLLLELPELWELRTEEEVVGGMIEVVKVGVDFDVLGIDAVKLEGKAKEAVVWTVKKGIVDDVALAFTTALEPRGAV